VPRFRPHELAAHDGHENCDVARAHKQATAHKLDFDWSNARHRNATDEGEGQMRDGGSAFMLLHVQRCSVCLCRVAGITRAR
jgi:hypothetical protein